MELAEWTSRLENVSTGYAEVYDLNCTPEWMLLKLMEEVGAAEPPIALDSNAFRS